MKALRVLLSLFWLIAYQSSHGASAYAEKGYISKLGRRLSKSTSRSRLNQRRYRYEELSKKMSCQKSNGKKHSSVSKSRGKSKRKDCEKDLLKEVLCSPLITGFETSILVLFNGNPELLSSAEETALEKSFLEAYESFDICDGYFRSIQNITLLSVQAQRRLVTRTTMSSSYGITGTCRGCPVTPTGWYPLLSNDAFRRALNSPRSGIRRRLTHSAAYDYGGPGNQSAEESDICTCPASSVQQYSANEPEWVEPAAPSASEFLEALNANIRNMVEKGIIANITFIESLFEEPGEVVSNDQDWLGEGSVEDEGLEVAPGQY